MSEIETINDGRLASIAIKLNQILADHSAGKLTGETEAYIDEVTCEIIDELNWREIISLVAEAIQNRAKSPDNLRLTLKGNETVKTTPASTDQVTVKELQFTFALKFEAKGDLSEQEFDQAERAALNAWGRVLHRHIEELKKEFLPEPRQFPVAVPKETEN
jgi:hypothetical protein